ncbi:MAG: radical SAM protein [Clostridium sp.]|uniref:radical SAM protein n=1 Tax=Clostridium sp. TaxID=1506 RepID=UPI0039E8F7DE
MSDLKKKLYHELEIKVAATVEGVNVDPKIFKNLELGDKYQEQVHCLFERDHEQHVGTKLPFAYKSPNGLDIPFRWDRRSAYSIKFEDGDYYLYYKENKLFETQFLKRPKYYGLKTSDGTPMSTVGMYQTGGSISVAYSNECALKDKGEDCLFCNINATKDAYGEAEGIYWKYPKQIAETYAAGLREGATRLNITGGFIPERREIDYYIDVAEAVKELTGLENFNGTAVIGAPLDFEVIEKYKEAGFNTIAMNLEIWDKNIYNTICPGKVKQCGGWNNWVKALENAAHVFGYGKVRSNLVAGIEPKQSILEGVEYLASKGVICFAAPWCPNPGSALEGHRTPEAEWHFDLNKKVAAIHKKAGFTYKQLCDVSAPIGIVHDIYKIEDGLLSVFN